MQTTMNMLYILAQSIKWNHSPTMDYTSIVRILLLQAIILVWVIFKLEPVKNKIQV